jgi:hypothetical protein
MLKAICVLFSVLFVPPLACAEVFKCIGKYGEALFQNFPCQFESIGTTSVAEAPIDGSPTGGKSADLQGHKKSSTNIASRKKSPGTAAEPRVGMTSEEVRAIWGEPTDTVQEEPGNGSRVEVWSYGSVTVRFDRRRRVTAIEE